MTVGDIVKIAEYLYEYLNYKDEYYKYKNEIFKIVKKNEGNSFKLNKPFLVDGITEYDTLHKNFLIFISKNRKEKLKRILNES